MGQTQNEEHRMVTKMRNDELMVQKRNKILQNGKKWSLFRLKRDQAIVEFVKAKSKVVGATWLVKFSKV
jgi:hypothetical protein